MFIELWHGLQQGPVTESFKQIVHEWNVENNTFQVTLKEFSDYGDPARKGLAAAPEAQPCLVLAPEYMTGKMMEALSQKRVVAIDQMLDKGQLEKIAPLIRLIFGDKQGKLVSLPFNPSCGVLFMNRSVLQAAGRDPDHVPQTMEELEEICRDLMAKGLVEGGYTCAWPAAYLVEVPAAQQNIALIVPDNGKLGFGNYRMSQEWLIKHFLDLRRQKKEGVFVYAGKDNNSKIPFIKRKVAFFMQGSSHESLLKKDALNSASPFDMGSGCLPTLSRGQTVKFAFPIGGAAIWVLDNPQTQKMIEGVRNFLNYLAGEKTQERWHKETAYVPVLATLPKKLEEYYKNHPLHAAVVEQTIEAPLGNYSFGIQAPNYAEARKELFDLIEKILDLNIPDEQVPLLLQEFDAKYSIPKAP